MTLTADRTLDATSNTVRGTPSQTKTFPMPGNVPLSVESVAATISNGSASAVTPTLIIKEADGTVIAEVPATRSIPAGDSGVATWALRLGGDAGGAVIGGGGIPGLLDSQDLAANTTVTATSSATANTLLTCNALDFDGSTTVRFEISLLVQIDMRASAPNLSGGFVIFELWDNGVFLTALLDYGVSGILYISSVERTIYLTPGSGSHTYSLRAWRGHGVGVGNPVVDVLADVSVGDPTTASSIFVIQVNPAPS